eukprot:scaffold67957_cov51-Phaeocystis_antarctica.AAC.1
MASSELLGASSALTFLSSTAVDLAVRQQMQTRPSGAKMCSSYGRSERSGSGSHAHVRSLCGNLSGKRACMTLTVPTKTAVMMHSVMSTSSGASPASEKPMKMAWLGLGLGSGLGLGL